MKKNKFKKVATALLLSATALGVAGCSTNGSKSESLTFTETAEGKLDKGMENQPEASYWFPEDLLEWEFAKDPDAKYNVGKIPLAKRAEKSSLTKVNDTQNDAMKVAILPGMNSSTSGNAPRGINNFDANTFSYWQYVDQLVYWGGSSGEGIIVPPSPDVIDASHKNGVPVLGTIFFPQTAHGGKIEWLDLFLEKDSAGNFPMVDKLIEVADVYGFDGWFINQETDTTVTSFDDVAEGKKADEEVAGGLTKEHADLMAEFIVAFKGSASEHLDIMWYDSMTNEGEMDWQNALTEKNETYLVNDKNEALADSMFLNFWWNTDQLAEKELLKASQKKAGELGIDPYELYAGIDVQAEGYMTPVQWNLFTDEGNVPYTSLGLYGPSWTYSSASDAADFETRENTFWVNAKGDPTQGTVAEGTEWPGISTYAVEQTALTELPFTTNFNLGNGYNYFIEGEKVSSMDWNNRSMQDMMPTYRWIFEHGKGNDVTVTADYADAYNGGNSLKLRGSMTGKETSLMKLYSSEVKLAKDTTFTTTAKAGNETELNLVLGYADGKTETFKGDKALGEDWTTVAYDVKAAADKVVTSISYEITAQETSQQFELHLGQIAINPKTKQGTMSVTGLTIEDVLFDEEGMFAGIRLYWDEDKEDAAKAYEIYQINEDKSRTFLGITNVANFYINGLERGEKIDKTDLEVVPLDNQGNRGKASKAVTMDWPDNSVPKASFTADRTLIAPGDKVTFASVTSVNTESIEWEFEGGDIATSTDEAPVVTYAEPGVYAVKLTAKNESGETPFEIEGFITVSEQAKGELNLLSAGAATEASSFVNDGEAPEFAVDGKLDSKWCATGNTPHHIILDLGKVTTVSEVQIAHAEAGGEGPDMNTMGYTIEISEDGKEYTQVARVTNNSAGNSTDTFAATSARYVKLTIDKPTQGSDSAARIYEVEVFGLGEVLK